MKSAQTLKLAENLCHKHLEVHSSFDHYTGIVTLHGLTRLATITGDPRLIEEARKQLKPYVKGERNFQCNFPNYRCGGNASAWFLHQGHLPEAAEPVRRYALEIMNEAPRNPEGILCHPRHPEDHLIWIDVAFAVSPFLLFSGLALDEPAWVEEGFQQTAKMVKTFHNPENGLLHQSRNFRGPGHISEDHWSRGNGWGIYALTELACHLPEDHPRKAEAIALYRDHVAACARAADKNGLWCQEMSRHDSYVETSGTGLILYALGAGIQAGIITRDELPRFEKSLAALLNYVSEQHDIFHTCQGCLCPGEGTILDYMAKRPLLNDHHAFGPLVLAYGQAHALGITEIQASPLALT